MADLPLPKSQDLLKRIEQEMQIPERENRTTIRLSNEVIQGLQDLSRATGGAISKTRLAALFVEVCLETIQAAGGLDAIRKQLKKR